MKGKGHPFMGYSYSRLVKDIGSRHSHMDSVKKKKVKIPLLCSMLNHG